MLSLQKGEKPLWITDLNNNICFILFFSMEYCKNWWHIVSKLNYKVYYIITYTCRYDFMAALSSWYFSSLLFFHFLVSSADFSITETEPQLLRMFLRPKPKIDLKLFFLKKIHLLFKKKIICLVAMQVLHYLEKCDLNCKQVGLIW